MEERGVSLLLLLLLLSLPGSLFAQAKAAASSAGENPPAYVVALTALEDGGLRSEDRAFLTKLPDLLRDELSILPPRYEDRAYTEELARRRELAARFDKGGELYTKLGDAALARLDPRIGGFSRSGRIAGAEEAVAQASEALDELLAEPSAGPPPSWPLERQVKLHDDKDLLFDPGGEEPLRAGRAQGIDLVVTGSARPLGAYLEVRLEGWDSGLGRRVFAWTGYAAPEDPGPLAKDFARRLASWLADAPMGRLDLAVKPASARLVVEGRSLDVSQVSLFSPNLRALSVSAWAPGYREEDRTLLIKPGEDSGLILDLSPQSYGRALLSLSPPQAEVLAGGRARDPAQPLELGGLRDIAVVSAPGYETAMAVIPASGDRSLSLALRPVDGLGPGKRADQAKDQVYLGLGLVAIGIPLTRLAQGYEGMYLEANYRLNNPFVPEQNLATTVYWAAAAGTAGAAVYTIFKLAALLGGLD